MSFVGQPRKGFNVMAYNWQKRVRIAKAALTDDERRILEALRKYGGGVDFKGTESLLLIKQMIDKGLCRGDVRNTWPTRLGQEVV